MNRCFRVHNDAVYENVRASLDVAWGHVPPVTCVDPAEIAPRDGQGRILLAVRPEFCEYEAVAVMLPQLLASGAVQEITEAEYRAALPQPTLP